MISDQGGQGLQAAGGLLMQPAGPAGHEGEDVDGVIPSPSCSAGP